MAKALVVGAVDVDAHPVIVARPDGAERPLRRNGLGACRGKCQGTAGRVAVIAHPVVFYGTWAVGDDLGIDLWAVDIPGAIPRAGRIIDVDHGKRPAATAPNVDHHR